eukprot:Pgem_evm1s19534
MDNEDHDQIYVEESSLDNDDSKKMATSEFGLLENQSAIDEKDEMHDAEAGTNSEKTSADIYPARLLKFQIGKNKLFRFKINPVSFSLSMVFMLAIIVFVVVKGEDSAKLMTDYIFYGDDTTVALANRLAWFFLGSIAFWLLFCLYLIVYYGHIKLGDEDPEFDDLSYFSMIFTAGAAMGIYFYGVNEGVGNTTSPSPPIKSPYGTQNYKDNWAMINTMFDWGVNCFVPYALVGILVAYQTFVKKMPMCMRSLYYEFLGDYVWGWLGDVIDGYCIISVMSGLLPSLGISVNSLLDGFISLGWIKPKCSATVTTDCSSVQFRDNLSMIIVAVIIIFATISVASGLNRGIKILAMFATIGSTSLWIMCFLLEDKPYILNITLNTLGQYMTNLVSLSLFTDPFVALKTGQGGSLEPQSK